MITSKGYSDPYEDGQLDHEAATEEQKHTATSSDAKESASSLYDPQNRYTYVDENFNYYPSRPEGDSLVQNAAPYARVRDAEELEFMEPFDHTRAQPVGEKSAPLARFFPTGNYPLAQRIEDKRRGIGRQKYPIVAWALAVAMLGVLIYELVLNWQAQGSPFSFKPVVNPMLGPSQSALIHVGARYPPCMKNISLITADTQMACLNDTANPPDILCSLSDVCGFGGFEDEAPNQSFRFVTPVFLHAGLVHYVLNMLAQLTASAQVEREMGSAGFLILYMAAGIFGNVLGGNFALVTSPSVGASGAIFGTAAVAWIDLFAHWRYHYKPVRKLIFLIIELVIGLAIGFIPYVDNFAHIGGFLIGLLLGMALYPIISISRRHKLIVLFLRIAAIPLTVILFVVLIRNFYKSDPYAACSWCRYLSCIPISSNNYCKGTGFTTTAGTSI